MSSTRDALLADDHLIDVQPSTPTFCMDIEEKLANAVENRSVSIRLAQLYGM